MQVLCKEVYTRRQEGSDKGRKEVGKGEGSGEDFKDSWICWRNGGIYSKMRFGV